MSFDSADEYLANGDDSGSTDFDSITGGKLVLETPDLAGLCKDYLEQDGEEQQMTALCIFGAHVDRLTPETQKSGALSPHLWGYTPKSLTDLCVKVGFKDIQILPAQGQHPGKNFRLEATK